MTRRNAALNDHLGTCTASRSRSLVRRMAPRRRAHTVGGPGALGRAPEDGGIDHQCDVVGAERPQVHVVVEQAIDRLLDKRLDGFGELFRMLSYQQVGSAAMLSRSASWNRRSCSPIDAGFVSAE